MESVEPLGIKGDEQAYRVIIGDATEIMMYNSVKDLYQCITSRRMVSEHLALFEQYLETRDSSFRWMNYIGYTLTHFYRGLYYDLWMVITIGNITKPKRYDKDRLIKIINEKLKAMTFYEIGYLSLMGLPVDLDEDYLNPDWSNARDWVLSSGALAVLYERDEFICNDEQNELLRKATIDGKI
ncbi:MAG: hypothetical protein ACTSSE_08685 [Candidatus Thorarchaeota archaeon]